MNLSKRVLAEITAEVSMPAASYFSLPEKVLQFGTGVLLRGLPDYFIDKANKQGLFNGRVVVVKSTATGETDAFASQDGMYTICVRGIEAGKKVEENILNASISRVLSARSEWRQILACAADPNMQVIISNTTEVGITLVPTDTIHAEPPESFPGKLLAFLYHRFKAFNGDPSKGMVIIPTELVPDNGKKLESIVEELAHINKLEFEFIDWLENANFFCSSLVDRIVPGKLPAAKQQEAEAQLGYTDDLMIMSEVYRLWAIEASDPKVGEVLSFAGADSGVVIAPDINRFRELKLRLLNGSHTFTCGLAHLAGFHTVKDAMNNEAFNKFITDLMMNEIVPAVAVGEIAPEEAHAFANSVLDRYRNPHIDHQWLSITMQYSSKMQMRNVASIQKYYQQVNAVPQLMAIGMAGHLLFMRSEKDALGKFWGEANDAKFLVNDDRAAYYADAWKQFDVTALVAHVLGDTAQWGTDLSALPGFTDAVTSALHSLLTDGARAVLQTAARVNAATV